MKLCGHISIEFPAGDYFALADHRKRLEDILAYVRSSYPEATFALRERRNRRALPLDHAPPRAATGALNAYAD
jgi:hypothetical protein